MQQGSLFVRYVCHGCGWKKAQERGYSSVPLLPPLRHSSSCHHPIVILERHNRATKSRNCDLLAFRPQYSNCSFSSARDIQLEIEERGRPTESLACEPRVRNHGPPPPTLDSSHHPNTYQSLLIQLIHIRSKQKKTLPENAIEHRVHMSAANLSRLFCTLQKGRRGKIRLFRRQRLKRPLAKKK